MSIADDLPATHGDGPSMAPEPPMLPPLTVSAVMVTKPDLISALRIYLPHLTDVEPIDGDRFLLHVGTHPGRPARTEPADGRLWL